MRPLQTRMPTGKAANSRPMTPSSPSTQDLARQAARQLKAAAPRDFKREGLKAVQSALRAIQEGNPFYADLIPEVSLAVRRKAGTGNAAKVIREIISQVLTEGGAVMSQTDLRKLVEQRIGAPVFKDWTKPLKPFALKKLPERLRGAGPPFTNIDVKKVKTLSDLHHEAGLAVSLAGNRPLSIRTSFAIAGGYVYLGDTRYKVQTTKSGKYEYQTVRIPVEDLKRLTAAS